MDILWPKERLQKIFSKDSIRLTTTQASGDGDSPMHCCRLCGGEGNLRCFCDTYVWEGVEERYDHLLYDCFGVQVLPTDGMICERCVRQLRMTQRFRALVQSAFTKPPSEFQSQMGIGEGFAQASKLKSRPKNSRLELMKKSTRTTITGPNKCRSERKSLFNAKVQVKRMNIACTVCKQKYPMLVPFEGWKKFICSRCKKKSEPRSSVCRKCNVLMPSIMMRDHLESHARTDLRGKSRLFSVPKKPSQISQVLQKESLKKLRYQCDQCSKKYSDAKNLITHVSIVHKHNIEAKDCVCAVCGKDMKTPDLLDRHMRTHTGQPMYQCDVCMRIFKGKRSFQLHYLTHGK